MLPKLFRQFLKIIFFIITIILFTTVPLSVTQSFVKPKLNLHEKLIVLSYDGFRFDYFNKTHTPRMDSLKSNGAFARYMNPQFMTKTFPNHQSIATGLYTESHGVVDHAVFDPKFGKVVSGLGRGDDEFWNFHENVAPVWMWNEWAGEGRISGVQWPGSDKPYGKNHTLPTYSLSYSKFRSFEARIDYVINWLTNDDKPANLIFMYFDEPDGQGHKYGPNSPQVSKAVERIDKITGYLVDQLVSRGIFHETNIFLLSDHGFEEASLRRVINISTVVDPSLYKVYGRSPVLNILPKEGKLDQVYNAFKIVSKSSGHFSVYKKDEIPETWHYAKNRRIMPILLVAEPGYVFEDYVIHLKKKFNITDDELDPDLVFGIHGYDSRSENMRPFFIAHGPAFKEGIEILPFDNVDLFPLICQMMKITIPPNNGSLDIVSGILKHDDDHRLLSSSSGLGISIPTMEVLIALLSTVSLM